MGNVAVSPCSNPKMELDEVLRAYSSLGFRKFEAFTSWVSSQFDYTGSPETYLSVGARCGMSFSSMHLPVIGDDVEGDLERSIRATEFARAIGASVVLFKASTQELYVRTARLYLDAVAHLPVIPVLQNHAGSPISTLADYRSVIEGIGDDRMKTTLEVGHFHSVGVSWAEGLDLLGESIALVHIKDQIGAQSVPFGTGEVDLPGLFARMTAVGYAGDYVVEMELADPTSTLEHLGGAVRYLQTHCEGAEL